MRHHPSHSASIESLESVFAEVAHDSSPALLGVVYEDLRNLARHRLAGEPAGITMQATGLVHETYLRLISRPDIQWDNRAHFFGAAAIAMRRILIDRARRVRAEKHGGGRRRIRLDEFDPTAATMHDADSLIALDEALDCLQAEDAELAHLVKLRYFAGLTIEQTADVLGVAAKTVSRRWNFARAWLLDTMLTYAGQ